MAGQPFGQQLQAKRLSRLLLIGQFGIGDQDQWMQLDRAAAGACTHADVFGIIGQQIIVNHQGGQQIVQLQPATAAEQRGYLR